MAISMAVGTSLSGIVYNKLGFYGAYGLSSLLIIIGLVYGWLFVEEVAPVALVDENKPFRITITEFFDFTQITQSMKTTFKKRPDTQRLKIIVLLIILMANSGTNNGSFCMCVCVCVQFSFKFLINEVSMSHKTKVDPEYNIEHILFNSLADDL